MAVNMALREKLQSWLLGFLQLVRITWASPTALLERVSQSFNQRAWHIDA
jgi:hypothetical protein